MAESSLFCHDEGHDEGHGLLIDQKAEVLSSNILAHHKCTAMDSKESSQDQGILRKTRASISIKEKNKQCK